MSSVNYVDACEHCDEPAPRGQRFCSDKCQEEDSHGCVNCGRVCGCKVCGMTALSVMEGPCPGCEEEDRRRWERERGIS